MPLGNRVTWPAWTPTRSPPGLLAIGEGGLDAEPDDQRLLERGSFVYDAPYPWCRRRAEASHHATCYRPHRCACVLATIASLAVNVITI